MSALSEVIKRKLVGTSVGRTLSTIRTYISFSKFLNHPEMAGVLSDAIGQRKLFKSVLLLDSNCLDIGAHIGSVFSLLVEIAPDGEHVAVEADHGKVAHLRKKFRNKKIFATALSDRDGEVRYIKYPYKSGLNRINLEGDYENLDCLVETIKATTLDSLLPQDYKVDFIKIDVEGAELLVLNGAKGVLKKYRPTIYFESTKSGHEAFKQSPGDIYDFLSGKFFYKIYTTLDFLNGSECLSRRAFLEAHNYPFRAFNFIAIPPTEKKC